MCKVGIIYSGYREIVVNAINRCDLIIQVKISYYSELWYLKIS
jgi:hypothetical protein